MPAQHLPPKTWIISLHDGSAAELGRKSAATFAPRKWKEADLEMALALAPEILGLGSALPVTRSGSGDSGPAVSPDQLYCDAMKRVHVVEAKSVCANLDSIAQVLSYGEMYRMAPRGEMKAARDLLNRKHNRQHCLSELRAWAGSNRIGPVAPDRRAKSARTSVRFPRGLSPRHIVLAPCFGSGVEGFADSITKRGTSLELLEVEMQLGNDAVALVMTPKLVKPWIEQIWGTFEHVWSNVAVRDAMDLVGWAEPLAYKSFSLSLRQDHRVRLLIEADPDGVWLVTTVPDNYGSAAEKAAANASLRGRSFPKSEFAPPRWYRWSLKHSGFSAADVELAGRIVTGLVKTFPVRASK